MYGYSSDDPTEIGQVNYDGKTALVIMVEPSAMSEGGPLEIVEGIDYVFVLVNNDAIHRALDVTDDERAVLEQIMQAATRAVLNWESSRSGD